MKPFFATLHPQSAFKRLLAPLRSNPSAIGGVVAGLLALLLVAFASAFGWSVTRGLNAASGVVAAIQAGDRLRALEPELTRAEAYLQLFSRGHELNLLTLDQQLDRVTRELSALEPFALTLSSQPWAVFHQMQEDWQVIRLQAAKLKSAQAVDLAGEGVSASEIISQRFASIRGRLDLLQQHLVGQQGRQHQLFARWQRQIQSMAWGLLVNACLLAGFIAWQVSWVWAKNIQEFTWSAQRLAAGDLSHRISVPESGSLRSLAQSINAIADRVAPPAAVIEEPLEHADQQV